jgi:hypothetical protein
MCWLFGKLLTEFVVRTVFHMWHKDTHRHVVDRQLAFQIFMGFLVWYYNMCA